MKRPLFKWCLVALLFLAAVLNYADKNTLALLAPTIQSDLHLSDQQYANIQNAFQVAYTVALLASGFIVDRAGPQLSLALFVGWWSLANMLTALAGSFAVLSGFRFMLGLGEAGNWTASPKVVAQWFPPKERGFAIGIYTAGTPLGMTLAPLLIIWLAGTWGWRSAFVVTGAMGVLWLVPWLWLCRSGGRAPTVSTYSPGLAPAESRGWSWGQAMGRVEVWCLLLGRMFSDPVWFFYQNWYPKYLVSERGLTQSQVKITWVIFLAAGLGSLCGGWIAGRFIQAGRLPEQVRLFTMLGCALFMPLSPWVASTSSLHLSLGLAALIVFMHLAWLTNISALVVDVVPTVSLGKVFGIVAAGSSIGAIMMNDLVAKLLKSYSYSAWFWIAAGLHLAVVPVLMFGVLQRKPLEVAL